MSEHFLTIEQLHRTLADGRSEEIVFDKGVNLIVGRPNTGKTKWLQTLDYLLGDSGEHPYFDDENPDEAISDKYSGARAVLVVSGVAMTIERRWKEPGVKGKVFVDGQAYDTMDFQRLLLEKLAIPLINFPKGNPMSGQTWPQLSFRILFRHIYRQQRFWSGLADQQSEPEQLAAMLQFLGVAQTVFTAEYGELVNLRLDAEKIRARRDQHAQALRDLALDVLSEPELSIEVNELTVVDASIRLKGLQDELLAEREILLTSALSRVSADREAQSLNLGDQRATLLQELEMLRRRLLATEARAAEVGRYFVDLGEEIERMGRASDAGAVLADLKVTHCPACDQIVQSRPVPDGDCFLCHQPLPDEPPLEELGSLRLRFERDRISSEKMEAAELLAALEKEQRGVRKAIADGEERLRTLDQKLAPARQAVSGLVQEDISAIDMKIGEYAERQRHIKRLGDAVVAGKRLGDQLEVIEKRIAVLREFVGEALESTDFELASSRLEAGMNAYLSAINSLRPDVWRHSGVDVSLSRKSFEIKVGRRKWNKVLGGTDTLYFLMAYHYGLMTLSAATGCHYPGLVIIDMPGEFSGDRIDDIENFVVQPFVNLMATEPYSQAQVIITGPSFKGLDVTNRVEFGHVYAAR